VEHAAGCESNGFNGSIVKRFKNRFAPGVKSPEHRAKRALWFAEGGTRILRVILTGGTPVPLCKVNQYQNAA